MNSFPKLPSWWPLLCWFLLRIPDILSSSIHRHRRAAKQPITIQSTSVEHDIPHPATPETLLRLPPRPSRLLRPSACRRRSRIQEAGRQILPVPPVLPGRPDPASPSAFRLGAGTGAGTGSLEGARRAVGRAGHLAVSGACQSRLAGKGGRACRCRHWVLERIRALVSWVRVGAHGGSRQAFRSA
jgi:hypothetical protein